MSRHIGVISGDMGDIAQKVLLPGDPLRAKYIAENFLENAYCYSEIRGMYGFTGTYKGKRVSVQGTGMGMPSISIYVNELLQFFDAKSLIRVGTCGAFSPDLVLRDIFIPMGATTDSNMNLRRFKGISYAAIPDFDLLSRAYQTAMSMSMRAVVGNVLTSDKFYEDNAEEIYPLMVKYGVKAVDMETCELYTLAARFGVRALTLMTVSDEIYSGRASTVAEREQTFGDMIRIALDII